MQDIDIKTLLNIDPYLASDSAFDKSNMVGNVMSQVTRDNKVWALPVVIEPSILKYDVERFNKAGVQVPASGWTVDTFADALKKLNTECIRSFFIMHGVLYHECKPASFYKLLFSV